MYIMILIIAMCLVVLIPRHFMGRKVVFVSDKYGNFSFIKVKKIDDELIHTRKGTYPIVSTKLCQMPFPIGMVRIYFVDFATEDLRGDFNTIQLYLKNQFLREISSNGLDIFGIISIGLSVVLIILIVILFQGQGDIKAGIDSIQKIFSQMGGV